MAVRGIRGAIDIPENTQEAIDRRTQELLRAIVDANDLDANEVISVFLTATVDLNAAYPAASARALGWTDIPLLDAQEIDVQGSMPRVVRVLMHVETKRSRDEVRHIYLGKAANLRPDISGMT